MAAGAVAAAAIAGLSYLGTWAGGEIAATQGVEPSGSSAQSGTGTYADGTYTGTGTGYRGDVTVQVTVQGGAISSIKVTSYRDDSQYFNLAKNGVILEILAQQSTEVNAVSGATFSSKGIMEAVANALADQSSVTASDGFTFDFGTFSDSSQTKDSSSQGSASSDSAASSQSAASGSYADGTYTGNGTGLRGTTKVTVTVQGGVITQITVDSYQDDGQFFSRAENTVISEIISQQSVNVNAVSGATFSSNSIMEAVANALGISFTNPNSTLDGHNRR